MRSQNAPLGRYLLAFRNAEGRKIALAVVLAVCLSLTQGIGLALLLPLLRLVGFSASGASASVAYYAAAAFAFVGIPRTLASVLAVYDNIMTQVLHSLAEQSQLFDPAGLRNQAASGALQRNC